MSVYSRQVPIVSILNVTGAVEMVQCIKALATRPDHVSELVNGDADICWRIGNLQEKQPRQKSTS